MFITLGMTGVDQDMMQKNLTCKNQKDAQKNMLSFSVVLFLVNVVFVALGGLLFLYIDANSDIAEAWMSYSAGENGDGDKLFAVVALSGKLGMAIGVFFMLGLIAAAYSSADSALTSLTTSLSVDFLGADKEKDKAKRERLRKRAHVIMSILLLFTIVIFKAVKSDSVVWELFKAANYTYGPLLGLFLFGIFSKRQVSDSIPLIIAVYVPVIMWFVNDKMPQWTEGYYFGPELLGINAFLVYIFLRIFSKKSTQESNN